MGDCGQDSGSEGGGEPGCKIDGVERMGEDMCKCALVELALHRGGCVIDIGKNFDSHLSQLYEYRRSFSVQ